jgi:hypothetical protein
VSVEVLTGVAPTTDASSCLDAFEVRSIRLALQRYDAITKVLRPRQPPDVAPDLVRVRQQVNYAWSSLQNAHYSVLGRIPPGLLRAAQDAAAWSPIDQETAAQILLSQAYQVTASALWKMKEIDLAWLAAERGLVLAEQTGDDLLISDAARRVAQGLMATDHGEQALQLLRADIDRLEPSLGNASPEYLSLYGMLFLLGSVIAGREGRASVACELIAEGGAVAALLGMTAMSAGRPSARRTLCSITSRPLLI